MNWFKRQPHDAAALHEQLKAKSAPGNYQPEDTRTLKSYHDELFPESKFNHNIVKRNWTRRNTDLEQPDWYTEQEAITGRLDPATAIELLKETDDTRIVEWSDDVEHREITGLENLGPGTGAISDRVDQWNADHDAPFRLKPSVGTGGRPRRDLEPSPLPNQTFVVYRAYGTGESGGSEVAWRGVPRFNNDYAQMNFLVRSGHLTKPSTYVTRRTIESYSPVYGSPTEIVKLFHITETEPVEAQLVVHYGVA